MHDNLKSAINLFIEKNGEDALAELLGSNSNQEGVLTIIANSGVHPLQEYHKRGEVFVASTGNIDFSSKDKTEQEIKKILLNVAIKLKSKPWKKIYLIPFGPSVLSMLIKSLVYRILYQDTIDILHVGSGVHYDIKVDLREIAVEAGTKEIQYPGIAAG